MLRYSQDEVTPLRERWGTDSSRRDAPKASQLNIERMISSLPGLRKTSASQCDMVESGRMSPHLGADSCG